MSPNVRRRAHPATPHGLRPDGVAAPLDDPLRDAFRRLGVGTAPPRREAQAGAARVAGISSSKLQATREQQEELAAHFFAAVEQGDLAGLEAPLTTTSS